MIPQTFANPRPLHTRYFFHNASYYFASKDVTQGTTALVFQYLGRRSAITHQKVLPTIKWLYCIPNLHDTKEYGDGIYHSSRSFIKESAWDMISCNIETCDQGQWRSRSRCWFSSYGVLCMRALMPQPVLEQPTETVKSRSWAKSLWLHRPIP